MTIRYNVNTRVPLCLGHQYDHKANVVTFEGCAPSDSGTMYFKLDADKKYLIPLADMSWLITQPMTLHAGDFAGQLVEITGDGEKIDHGDKFRVTILQSIEMGEEAEIHDPTLDLWATKLTDMYNLINISEGARDVAEELRVSNEENRARMEAERQANESSRETAEAYRVRMDETRDKTTSQAINALYSEIADLQRRIAEGEFKGEKGDNYELTTLDKEEIASKVRFERRITPISESVDIDHVYETVGCPEYINTSDLIKYSSFGLSESGWYLFARINSRYGESVSEGFSIVGASGVITPLIGSDHVDIAVRFGVIAESQRVIVNWGASEEIFVFKATDLAIRNLDYRVTFYLYNIDDYCEWTYEITTDTKFVKDKGYYKLIDGQYVKQDVRTDEAIPANMYYCHKSLAIKDFTRNMSYTLDTTVDCPVTIHLPEISDDNYGAWFEVQMNFLQTYSVTIIPHEGQKVSANGVHSPKIGINIINILYHKPTNTWLPTVTNWAVSSS